MTDWDTERFFDCFVPALARAGRYALRIRDQLRARPAKAGDAWTSVVTDADLGVQHYLEAVALAEFPEWNFWGEERDASFNTRYFDEASRHVIALDPINGTRMYRDGGDGFDILVSLIRDGRLQATLSYMPARGRYYGASRGGGAFTGATREPMRAGSTSMALTLYRADAWRDLLPDEVEVFDIVDSYRANDPRCCLNNVFGEGLGGYLMGPTPLLDVGATAFTVAQAGGRATLPDGRPFDYFDAFDPARAGALLVCTNPRLHDLVSDALARHAR